MSRRNLFVVAFALRFVVGCSGNAAPLPSEDPALDAAREVRKEAAPRAQTSVQTTPDAPAALAPPEGGATVQGEQTVPSRFTGAVTQQNLQATYNFFMHGVMQVAGEPEALILVQTDDAALCSHLARGTMPRNATMFAVALIDADGNAPKLGSRYLAPNARGRDDALQALAYFRKLGPDCEITPPPTGAEAQDGYAVLNDFVPGKSAAIDYAFTLDTGDHVDGHVAAQWCDAPALFEHPEALMVEVEPEDCR